MLNSGRVVLEKVFLNLFNYLIESKQQKGGEKYE